MKAHRPRWQYILLFLTFLSVSLAASPTSFCKCTCFTNSSIIPLDDIQAPDPPTTSPDTASNSVSSRAAGTHKRTCNDCNKQFCLDYNLPICKEATEEDVFTTCFQRDSTKDELIVFLFIFATLGLLGWAGVKPWVERWKESRSRGSYTTVSGQ